MKQHLDKVFILNNKILEAQKMTQDSKKNFESEHTDELDWGNKLTKNLSIYCTHKIDLSNTSRKKTSSRN